MKEIDFDLSVKLAELGYSSEAILKLSSMDVLVFPDERTQSRDRSSNSAYITHEMVDIGKYLKSKIKVEVITKQNAQKKYLELKSAEIFLPLLVVIEPVAMAVVKAVIGTFISKAIERAKKQKNSDPIVDLHIVKKTESKWMKLEYHGPANALETVLKSLED